MADLYHNHKLCLVLVPAYNAADYLPKLIPRLRRVVDDSQILIVNDGSTDRTESILTENNVNHLTFARNRGKGTALVTGFEYAREQGYRSVLTIDADLQHLPEEIPQFLTEDDGESLIVGTRSIHRSVMPFARCVSNNTTSMVVSVFSTQRVRDSQSGFRLIPLALLDELRLRRVGYDFESELLFKAGAAGFRIKEVPISTIYEGSPSFINPFADTFRFIRLVWKRVWV